MIYIIYSLLYFVCNQYCCHYNHQFLILSLSLSLSPHWFICFSGNWLASVLSFLRGCVDEMAMNAIVVPYWILWCDMMVGNLLLLTICNFRKQRNQNNFIDMKWRKRKLFINVNYSHIFGTVWYCTVLVPFPVQQ